MMNRIKAAIYGKYGSIKSFCSISGINYNILIRKINEIPEIKLKDLRILSEHLKLTDEELIKIIRGDEDED